MMVNIRTKLATVNFAFSASKKAALIEYTTITEKLHHCTLCELKIQVFTLSDALDCPSIRFVIQKKHTKSDFLTKSDSNMLQTCISIGFAYLYSLNLETSVAIYLCCSVHQCKRAGYTMFLLLFVPSN